MILIWVGHCGVSSELFLLNVKSVKCCNEVVLFFFLSIGQDSTNISLSFFEDYGMPHTSVINTCISWSPSHWPRRGSSSFLPGSAGDPSALTAG